MVVKVNVRIDRIPVFISKYNDKWYMAAVPHLDLVTQGRTFKEARENMADLLNEYFKDPHTVKPKPESLMDIVFIPVKIPQDVSYGKTQVTA